MDTSLILSPQTSVASTRLQQENLLLSLNPKGVSLFCKFYNQAQGLSAACYGGGRPAESFSEVLISCRNPCSHLRHFVLPSTSSHLPHFPVSTICCITAISKQGRPLPASCWDCLQMLLQWQELATIQPAGASSEVSELVELQASAADYPFSTPFHFTARISALATVGALNLFNDPMGCNLYSPSHLLPISAF